MRISLVALGIIALSACSGGEDLASADKAVDRFHEQLNTGQYQTIYKQSAPDMKSANNEQELVKLLSAIHVKLGQYKSGTRNSWRVNYGTSANTVILFDSIYEKGKAQETFTFFNGADSPLIGYNINSPTLITG